MYAVIRTGGKQYKVSEKDLLRVEKLAGEKGEEIELSEVLLLGEGENSQIGTPRVENARVTAEVIGQERGEKIIVFKKKRRKKYRRRNGHRQELTLLKIKSIHINGE